MDAHAPGPAPARGARSPWRPFLFRGLAFAAVYLVAVAGLALGVGVTERDLASVGLAEKAYYALGLFVLGGLDLGTPIGGPPLGRALLWAGYFLAPVITASALVEAVLRLIGPLALRVRPLSGHIVLGGAGRLTLLYVRRLRALDRRRTVVVVELNPSHPLIGELRELHHAVIVTGDITRDRILRGLRLTRAHRVLLLTGDDFVNLDAAAKMLKLAPTLSGRIVAHVSDLGFIRETSQSSVARHCEIFNGHEFAATHLVREHLIGRFRSTPEHDLVVMGGFGRFGQTVLHQLQQHALGSFGHVIIIDELAAKKVRAFEAEPGFAAGYQRVVIDGDLLDPDVWKRVVAEARAVGHDPVVIVGSGNDGTNLHVALAIARQYPRAYVISRSFRASPFTDEVAGEAGVHAFNLASLIESGMPATWF